MIDLVSSIRTLGRSVDAERCLRRAVELDPQFGPAALHLALALRDNAKTEESQRYFAAFHDLGNPQEERRAPGRGLLEYLSLGRAEQKTQRIANLRRAVQDRPEHQELRLRLGIELLETGNAEEAQKVLTTLTGHTRIEAAAEALTAAGQYAAAKTIAERLGKPSIPYATAVFHLEGAEPALRILDEIDPSRKTGDYWLIRAQMLDARGDLTEAIASLNRGFAASPTRVDLYHEAAMLLVRRKRLAEASTLLEQATQRIPEEPHLLLDQAVVLELQQRFEDARKRLASLERRWPEWSRPWVVHGISFMSRGKAVEALPLLETAIALGDDSSEGHYYLASALAETDPGNRARALKEVNRALVISPDDPYASILAGRLHLEAGSYDKALRHLQHAAELLPESVEPHYQLMRLYSALGKKEKAQEEAALVNRFQAQDGTGGPTPGNRSEEAGTGRATHHD